MFRLPLVARRKRTSLGYQLGFSYVLVTTGALLVVQLLLLLGVSWWQQHSCLLWRWTLPDLQTRLSASLDLESPQGWLQTWVESGVVRSAHYGLDLAFYFSPEDVQRAWLLDASGQPLAWLPPQTLTAGERPALPPELDLNRAQPAVLDAPGGCVVAVPLREGQNWLLFWYAASRLDAAWWRDTIGLLLPSMVVILPLTALIGFAFGALASRPLVRRLRAIIKASESWAQGRFTETIRDQSDDEIGALSRHLNYMAEQLQNLLQTRQELAALQERNRLARDLHDSIKQQVFAAGMQAAAARQQLEKNPAEAAHALAEVEELLSHTRQELTTLIHELRPAAPRGGDLAAALQMHLSAWTRRTGIQAEWTTSSLPLVSASVAREIERILQEALSNVARHSQASRVQVSLAALDGGIRLLVRDDGRGFDVQQAAGRGLGLTSMEERARLMGGIFRLESQPGVGTVLEVWLPTEPQTKGDEFR